MAATGRKRPSPFLKPPHACTDNDSLQRRGAGRLPTVCAAADLHNGCLRPPSRA